MHFAHVPSFSRGFGGISRVNVPSSNLEQRLAVGNGLSVARQNLRAGPSGPGPEFTHHLHGLNDAMSSSRTLLVRHLLQEPLVELRRAVVAEGAELVIQGGDFNETGDVAAHDDRDLQDGNVDAEDGNRV
jgi:hypothetical protein